MNTRRFALVGQRLTTHPSRRVLWPYFLDIADRTKNGPDFPAQKFQTRAPVTKTSTGTVCWCKQQGSGSGWEGSGSVQPAEPGEAGLQTDRRKKETWGFKLSLPAPALSAGRPTSLSTGPVLFLSSVGLQLRPHSWGVLMTLFSSMPAVTFTGLGWGSCLEAVCSPCLSPKVKCSVSYLNLGFDPHGLCIFGYIIYFSLYIWDNENIPLRLKLSRV